MRRHQLKDVYIATSWALRQRKIRVPENYVTCRLNDLLYRTDAVHLGSLTLDGSRAAILRKLLT